LIIPDAGVHIWEWFTRLNNCFDRIGENGAQRLRPSDFKAWCDLTATIVTANEYEIMCDMDRVWCEETDQRIKSWREREKERMAAESKANAPRKGRRK
jgi:hypothetical protein